MIKFPASILFLFILLCFPVAASAATFTVNTTGDTLDNNLGNGICADASSNCSLRAAISEANALAGDDTINVPPGFYTQSVVSADEDANAGGDWDITSNITLNGQPDLTDPDNPVLVVLQAANAPNTATERVLHIASPTAVVTVNFVLIRFGRKAGGTAANVRGGGLNNGGTLTLNNSSVMDNRTSEGGGIFNSATITLNNTSVQNNTAAIGNPVGYGGGMYSLTSPSSPPNSTVTINNSFFINNTMNSQGTTGYAMGGGLAINASSPVAVSIDNTIFSGNQANGGGGPGGVGGGIGGGLRMEAGFGAASTLNITNSTFQFNTGSGLQNSTQAGAGVYLWANNASLTATLDKVKFNGNFATAAQGTGLHVAASNSGGVATVNTRNSTFSGNHDGAAGGGVYLFSNASLTANFTNSTFSGNSVSGGGGALTTEQTGGGLTASFDYCTITNNSSTANTGALNNTGGGTVNLRSTVVAGNGASSTDFFGIFVSQDYNHFGNPSGGVVIGSAANNTTGNAMLGALADNGGPTLTHLPDAASPLVDAIPNGTNGCGNPVFGDQRGFGRPFGSGCDKGSVERGATLAAGPWTLSGTVKTTTGIPIRNAAVTISGGNLPFPVTVFTGNFGTYQFTNLSGNEYTLIVSVKRFHFNDPILVVQLDQNRSDVDFIANAPFSREVPAVKSKSPR